MKAALKEAAEEWGIDPKAEMYKLPAMHVGCLRRTRCRSNLLVYGKN